VTEFARLVVPICVVGNESEAGLSVRPLIPVAVRGTVSEPAPVSFVTTRVPERPPAILGNALR